MIAYFSREGGLMTKSELVERLVEANPVLSRKESEVVVNLIFDSMCEALK